MTVVARARVTFMGLRFDQYRCPFSEAGGKSRKVVINDTCPRASHFADKFGRDLHIRIASNTSRNEFRGRENAGDHKVAGAHSQGTSDEEGAAPSPVDVEEHDCGEDDKKGVLYSGSDKIDISSKSLSHQYRPTSNDWQFNLQPSKRCIQHSRS